MKKALKKLLALVLVASMLLPTSVTAKEVAPTVGGNKTTQTTTDSSRESAPTVTKQKETPTSVPTEVPDTVPTTTEAKTEASKPETVTTEENTKTVKSEKTTPVPTTDATEKVDEKIKDTELDGFKESNDKEKVTKELLIKADKESNLPSDGKVLSSYEDTYLVSFPNTDAAKKVYEDKNTDASLNIPFGIATNVNDTSASNTVVEPEVLDNLEEVIKSDDENDASYKISEDDYSIAVIDTGMPKTEKNVEFVSMLGDEGYDDHGHGTLMLKSIRGQNKDAKILSIKALNKEGYGDAATIYAAIKYAIERKVSVINLSISGYATEGNKIIEDAIKEAISSGIIVVGAAGNDNLPASAFIPGGIDEAIIVGACDDKNQRKSFSNYGITVDYYANASSTSEAAAIVTGVLSANNGDISKLDETFFKTPDLSIFDEDLKKYHTPSSKDDDDPGINDGDDKNVTDDELLLKRLYKFVDYGGVLNVAEALTRVTNNSVENPRQAIKNTYANSYYYVLEPSLIDITQISVSGTGWGVTGDDYEILMNAGGEIQDGPFVYYSLGSGNGDSADHTVSAPVTITFPNCIRDVQDGSLHNWIITVTSATFEWGNINSDAGYKQTREDLILMKLVDKGRPWFTTGAHNGAGTSYTKVDSANTFSFVQSVSDAPTGSLLLTGFADIDQYQKFPNTNENDGNYVGERIVVDDVNTLGTGDKNIWTYSNYSIDIGDATALTNGIYAEGWGTSINDNKGTILMAVSATGGTAMKWGGCRCMTQIGLTIDAQITPSTINTYVNFENADGTATTYGTWSDYSLMPGHPATGYPGAAYAYTYDGTGASIYHDVSKTFAEAGTPYDPNSRTISYTYTKNDANFYLHVPRIRYTYRFHDNKPTTAASTVTNMPDNITKPAQAICGNYNRTPVLKGWNFLGFFDTPAATGGNAYNSNEQMLSDKDFYARWEPMKYYVRYNGNGATNFNENATNGMQVGEYTQNVVSGSVAYQIFEYDHVGEALRANGFTRRGYSYVCWNSTATRTGTDYNPGYVKPANVNWIKGDGTDPTAALDGSHTYPVVDLYAVWRQKLGTETLTVISEETGNPVPNVNVKLTNTSNNAERATGTTNANGQVTVNNLHWFPYKWTSTSVPAGYKEMQAVDFSINPALTTDESFLTVNNTRILYMKHVKLTLNSIVDDIIEGENAPSFMYHVTGKDVAGVTHSYDVMVQTDVNSKKGKNVVPVDSGTEEPYMFAGEYTVTQYDVSRYIPRTAVDNSNTTPVGINAKADLKNNDSAEVTFPYGIKQYGGFSGVHSIINKLTK